MTPASGIGACAGLRCPALGHDHPTVRGRIKAQVDTLALPIQGPLQTNCRRLAKFLIRPRPPSGHRSGPRDVSGQRVRSDGGPRLRLPASTRGNRGGTRAQQGYRAQAQLSRGTRWPALATGGHAGTPRPFAPYLYRRSHYRCGLLNLPHAGTRANPEGRFRLRMRQPAGPPRSRPGP